MSLRSFVFNHFPKTGGISLLTLFRQNLRAEEISRHLEDHEIRLQPASSFEQYRLITGHFSVLTQMAFSPERSRLTLLRNPIKRIHSAYTFYRMQPEQNLLTTKAKQLSFAEFVRYFQDSPQVIYDTYTHHFAAIGKDYPGFSKDSEALLAAARHNLAAFDFVGISEEMENSFRLLCHELGWPLPIVIPFENRSGSEASFDRIDSGTMQLLLYRNQNDLKLYEFATQLFREHCRKAAEGIPTQQLNLRQRELIPFAMSPMPESRRATISSVSTSWLPTTNSHVLEIGVTFDTRISVPELGLGVMITNASGDIVWGANTAQDGLPLEFAVDRQTNAVFLLQCELPPGEYFVTVALSEDRRLGFHDHWIDKVMSFSVGEDAAATDGYRVQPLHFWSAINQGNYAAVSPWRNEKGLPRLRHQHHKSTVSSSLRPVSRADNYFLPESKLNLRAYNLLDLNARIAKPRISIKLVEDRVEFLSDSRRRIRVEVTNLGNETLSSRYANPVHLSYHWLSESQIMIVRDGLRSPLNSDILPGNSVQNEMIVELPSDQRNLLLCLTLVQEFVCWFDLCEPGNRLLLRFANGLLQAA